MFPTSQSKMKTLWILGDFYTVKVSGDETDGRYSVWEIEVAPNSGPPLHRHSKEDESFYVLDGEFSFPYGNSREAKARKGQFIYVPRGEFHTYKNISRSSSGKLLLIIAPPQFEKFFEEVGIPVEDGKKSSFQSPQITPAAMGNVVKSMAKYGIDIKL
jgi:quercetin dioxygenase-like cupin family protein